MSKPVYPSIVRDFRCYRCGHLPRRANIAGIRGLRCSCRHYTVPLRQWWRQFAVRERNFEFPDQVPPEALRKTAPIIPSGNEHP
ncbi:MAG: hypothetical protein EOP85_16120 [Verrucomicrobiaceae bacterium]|nr:MAG: hypothetical protein EOP85_16120 [Verrucomicrobiaceae bacterium]